MESIVEFVCLVYSSFHHVLEHMFVDEHCSEYRMMIPNRSSCDVRLEILQTPEKRKMLRKKFTRRRILLLET